MDETQRPTFQNDARMFVIMAIAALVLFTLYLSEKSDLDRTLGNIKTARKRYNEAHEIVQNNADRLLPRKILVRDPDLLAKQSLSSVIMKTAEDAGIRDKLDAVLPGEDSRKKLVKARVQLRNVPIAKLVEFLVRIQNLSAGISDVDARLTMVGYNIDNWELTVNMAAKMPAEGTRP